VSKTTKPTKGGIDRLVVPIGTTVMVEGEAGGMVAARATIDGLELIRHFTIRDEVMFLTQEG
jgi:hypothetical protein